MQEEEDDEYLESLEQQLVSAAETPRRGQSTRQTMQVFMLAGRLKSAYTTYLESPGQTLLFSALALLFGFYLAGALSTIFGAKGFWEPVIAVGPLVVTELVSKAYYSRDMSQRSVTLKLLNAWKNGLYLGIVLDAIKLAG